MSPSKPRLLVVRGPVRGRELSLEKAEIMVGRAADNDLVIADLSVSRYHLTLSTDEIGVHARDRGSENGTLLNDEPLLGGRVLRDGDELELGNTVVRFVHPVITSLARPIGRAITAEIAHEVENGPLSELVTPDPVTLPLPAVRGRRPRRSLGTPLAILVLGLSFAGGVWMLFPHLDDVAPAPRPSINRLPAREPIATAAQPPTRPRSVDIGHEAQTLYAQRRFADAVDLLRQAGGEETIARDYAAVGAGMARGDAALADPTAALAAYQEALTADERSGAGAHAALLRGKIARAAGPAAATYFEAGRYEQARAACDLAEGGGADVAAVREKLESAAGGLFSEAGTRPATDAATLYRRILRMVPPSSEWHVKALARLGE